MPVVPDKLTVGGLFSGIGGLEKGLEDTGRFETRWQCERDPHALSILARHWPNIPRYTDVREITADTVERVDVLAGGFPCQDISNAGLKRGLTGGERSILWFEMWRLLRDLRPKYAVVENVAAILVRGVDSVLASLAEIGYDAEWQIIPALAFGAPHLRPRFILVAYLPEVADADGGQSPGAHEGLLARQEHRGGAPGAAGLEGEAYRAWALGEGDAGAPRAPEPAPPAGGVGGRGGVGGAAVPRVLGTDRPAPAPDDWWLAEPGVGRMADGVPAWMDRLTRLGNAVVPQLARFVGERVAADAVRRGYIA